MYLLIRWTEGRGFSWEETPSAEVAADFEIYCSLDAVYYRAKGKRVRRVF